MAVLELVTGPMRAGKTTYAKKSGKRGISFDEVMSYSNNDYDVGFKTIRDILNGAPKHDFILDGWFSIYNQDPRTVIDFQQDIGHEIKFTVFYDIIASLESRAYMLGEASKPYQTREELIKVFDHIVKMYVDELPMFDFEFRTHTDGRKTFYDFKKLLREEKVSATEQDVDQFLERFNSRGGDNRYQTIPLPFGKTLAPKHEDTIQAMEQAMAVVDFRGKTVFDAGCYHCNCTFAAEDAGAKSILGVDSAPSYIDNARDLKSIWGYDRTELALGDMDGWNFTLNYDVIMCFNMIQYTRSPEAVVRNLFEHGDVLVFESYDEFLPLYEAQRTHELIYSEESKRWQAPSVRRNLYYYKRRS